MVGLRPLTQSTLTHGATIVWMHSLDAFLADLLPMSCLLLLPFPQFLLNVVFVGLHYLDAGELAQVGEFQLTLSSLARRLRLVVGLAGTSGAFTIPRGILLTLPLSSSRLLLSVTVELRIIFFVILVSAN